jgi:hypothetical protein
MRPPRIPFQNSVPIAVLAIAFLMVFSWTVILASAQGKIPQEVTENGTVLTAEKLVLQKYLPLRILLSGTVYSYSGSTKFLDGSGQRLSRKSIPVGSLVNIVYITGKKSSEIYPFQPSAKVLLRVQVVAAKSK